MFSRITTRPLARSRNSRGLQLAVLLMYVASSSGAPLGMNGGPNGCCCSSAARAAGTCCCLGKSADSLAAETADLPPCCRERLEQEQLASCCRGRVQEPVSREPAVTQCGCERPIDHGVLLNPDPRVASRDLPAFDDAGPAQFGAICDEDVLSRLLSPPTPPPRLAC